LQTSALLASTPFNRSGSDLKYSYLEVWFCKWPHSCAHDYGYSNKNSKFSIGNAYFFRRKIFSAWEKLK